MKAVFKNMDAYLLVKCEGEFEPITIKNILLKARDQATKYSYKNIIFNCSDLSLPDKNYYRYLAGIDIADILPRPFKISIIYPEKKTTKFTETVAVNRGANVMVHHDMTYAIKWLFNDLD